MRNINDELHPHRVHMAAWLKPQSPGKTLSSEQTFAPGPHGCRNFKRRNRPTIHHQLIHSSNSKPPRSFP